MRSMFIALFYPWLHAAICFAYSEYMKTEEYKILSTWNMWNPGIFDYFMRTNRFFPYFWKSFRKNWFGIIFKPYSVLLPPDAYDFFISYA